MPRGGGWLAWAALVAAATAGDLAVRFVLPFDLTRVLVVETALFLGTALTMVWLIPRAPARRRWLRVLQWTLAWSFALAAVRAGLWASGGPVALANLTVLALGALVLAAAWARWRRRGNSSLPRP